MLNIEVMFDDIYARYYPAAVRYAAAKGHSRAIAEEIANETFERLWRRRLELAFENEPALLKWIYKTAGLVMMEQNRKSPHDADLSECENYIADTDKIGEQVEEIQYDQYLSEIEQSLPESERILFRMIFIEKKTYAACADELQMRQVTMRANISRLRKKLRPFVAEMLQKTK